MNSEFNIDKKRQLILDTNSHILIEGGPGSGKTTIALLKAKQIIIDGLLKPNQKILFLSFARATVSRIEEQAKNFISKEDKKSIEVNTYHGFTWAILKSYGYLLGKHRNLDLITPHNLASRISLIPEEMRENFKRLLFQNEGLVCFDLFSELASEIFQKSNKICSIISSAYPIIIVDEFQDTDINEWNFIKLLGQKSTILALADLEQRIFEFRGASITRIPQYVSHFSCTRIDFGKENNRSNGTDITNFGDDILSGSNKNKKYANVEICKYPFTRSDLKLYLKLSVLNSIKRLKSKNNWSLAILVRTKADTLNISSYLNSIKIYHEVLIDPTGPALSAKVIAKILELHNFLEDRTNEIIEIVIEHFKGRKKKLTTADIQFCTAIQNFIETKKLSGNKRKELINEIKTIIQKRQELKLIGIPEQDWLSVRALFKEVNHPLLKAVYEDAQFIRLLNKGAVLSEKLAETWRLNNTYENASVAIENALIQEHFSMTNRVYKGIFIMNIHKAKGKEFDEVIVWEELYRPLVREDLTNPKALYSDRILLRVAATRAKSRVTFLTPVSSPCILL